MNLDNWAFEYDTNKEQWTATNNEAKYILRASRIEVLVELIGKTGGDPEQIEKLLDTQ